VDLPRPVGAGALTAALRDAVASGRLCGRTPLPSTRALAADLGVSRGVVVEAYERLIAEGRLVARRGAGTMVAEAAAVSWEPPPAPESVAPTRRPLRPGVPNLGLFPHAAWRRASDAALTTMADADLDYPDPAGAHRLRAQLAAYLGRVRGARTDPGTLWVTAGAAQAFALLARALLDAGIPRIGMEDPGSPSIRDHFVTCGLTPVPIAVDDAGLRVTALASSGVRAVFVTPAHQFPTGVVLGPERREALVRWARETGGLIVEDDYDAEFRYDRDPVGCVQGIAPDVTVLVGSVSKVLAPALRLGWLCAPRALVPRIVAARGTLDIGNSVLPQLALAELLSSGAYDQHARRARRAYRARRDAVVAAVRRHLPGAEITGVAAGLHLVVRFPDTVDDRAVDDRAVDDRAVDDRAVVALAEAAGLGPMALSATFCGPGGTAGLILGYAGHSPDQLGTAVERLARVMPPPWR